MLQDRPRFALLSGPTPIERLARLEHVLAGDAAPPLFGKRDDVMGVGGGGNKLRKLEFLIGDAQAQGCDTFVTTGGRQSNHARLSAAASARAGLACELVLADMVDRDDESYRRNGNILLDGLFGARSTMLPATPTRSPLPEPAPRTCGPRAARPMSSGQGDRRRSDALAMPPARTRSWRRKRRLGSASNGS